MNNTLKIYNHKIRNLIPLTKSEINLLKENITAEQLIILIIMCNDIINDTYKDIIKK
jgi:hypothetical protein